MKEWIIENTTIKEEKYDEIMSYSEPIETKSEIKTQEDRALFHIINFTINKPNLLTCIKWNIKKQNHLYQYKEIIFGLLYDIYPDEDLFSIKRVGQCHIKSHKIGINSSLDIVTAICNDYRNGHNDFLHTFLKDNETNTILDYTLNLVMKKDDYYKLLKVREIKTIENKNLKRISNLLKEVIKEQPEIGKKIDIREPLCFPEEIEKSLLKLTKKKTKKM